MTAQHRAIGRALPNERAAIEHLCAALPADYLVVSNVELRTPQAGRTYEHDVVVVAPHAIFAVELKAWSGRTRGNRDRWELEGGRVVQSPIPLHQQKSRVLKGLLAEHSFRLREVWVQPLIYLTARDARVELTRGYDDIVCTQADIVAALTDASRWAAARALDQAQRRAVEQVLLDLGHQPQPAPHLGPFVLHEQLPANSERYTPWRASRAYGGTEAWRTLHAYPIKGGDETTRSRHRDLARREANLHERLRGGPGLIGYLDLEVIVEPEEVFVLSFEDTSGLLPIPDWIARHDPSREARLDVAERLTEALRFVHRRDIVHRRLSPQAVLVPNEPVPEDVRLYAFELARDLTRAVQTVNSDLWRDAEQITTAPELLRGGEATRRSDRYALGATLYALLADTAPFDRPEDALNGLAPAPLRLHGTSWSAGLERQLHALLDPDPMGRPELDEVLEALRHARRSPRPAARQTLQAGARLCRIYELVKILGEGASGVTWLVRHTLDGRELVAKVARSPQAAEGLVREADVLQAVQHPNLVRYHSREPHEGTTVVFLNHTAGVDGREWALLADPLSPECITALGAGLFGALGALHTAGWLHRDVKPENLVLAEPDGTPTLIDLGLAERLGVAATHSVGGLTVGTSAYKDPLLFRAQRWAPRDDLFAAWLTLWELLTDLHPFGGVPTLEQAPHLDAEALPATLSAAQRHALASAARRALAFEADHRPGDAAAAAAAWRMALAPAREAPANLALPLSEAEPASPPEPAGPDPSAGPPTADVDDPAALPRGLSTETPLDALALSVRALRAVRHLGLSVAGQVRRLTPDDLRGLRNVGRKTAAELVALRDALIARLGPAPEAALRAPSAAGAGDPGSSGERNEQGTRPVPPALESEFYPPLAEDDRPLSALQGALTPALTRQLIAQGVFTVGGVASLPRSRLRGLTGVGPNKVAGLLDALRALAGQVPGVATLAELDEALRAELRTRYDYLALAYGLHDGVARPQPEVAARLKHTRQAVSAALDLSGLRGEVSAARHLLAAVRSTLPPVGFDSLDRVAVRLATALPPAPGLSARGYARLAAGLLDPDHRAVEAPEVEWVCLPPWQPAQVEALRQALSQAANWPPASPEALAELLVERAGELGLLDHLRSRGAEAALLPAVRGLCPDVRATPEGHLFTPPVTFADALAAWPDKSRLWGPLDEALAALRDRFEAVSDPHDLAAELAQVGLRCVDDRVESLETRVAAPPAPVRIVVDATVRTRSLVGDGSLDVEELVQAANRGGFRVVGLPPARHHHLSERLFQALRDRLGAAAVRWLDLDAELMAAVRATGLWTDALAEERRKRPDWSWLLDMLGTALDRAITEGARPGVVTVLGRPTLLGPLGLMDWLGGLYERARGGRHGLLVLALPGGVHQGRVRLNEQYALAYTPDMAAVVHLEVE